MDLKIRTVAFSALVIAALAVSPSAQAGFGDLLMAPKTLFDRAIEARGSGDIVSDNLIVLKVNKLMADIGSIKASTTIYEQRLLITGLFDNKADFQKFKKAVRALKDVKKLYWHATYMSEADQKKKKNKAGIRSWDDVLILQKKAEVRLISTRGVADVNFRVAADSFGTLFLMGRARSNGELKKALARMRDGNGVRKVINYAIMRP